ncbi:MAG: hypothetical protein RL033_4636 [Pseudomonadota bacterium]
MGPVRRSKCDSPRISADAPRSLQSAGSFLGPALDCASLERWRAAARGLETPGPRDGSALETPGSARRAQHGELSEGTAQVGKGSAPAPSRPTPYPRRPAPCEPSMQHVRALLAAALRCCVGLLYRCQAAPPRVSSPQPRLPSSRAPSSLAGANRAPLRLHRPRAASHHSRMTAASVFDPPGRHEAREQAVDRPAGFSQLLGASHFLLVQFGQGSTSRPIGVTSRARGARWWPAHPLRACE